MKMNRYKVHALVGEGSFGHVYRAIRKEDNQVVAIKVISKRCRTSRDLKTLRRECEIQAHLKHPNVIEMLESFETKHDLVVVTEFACIDLHRYMEKNGYLSEDKGQRLICDLVSALYYLHSNRILHRDLKPQNVLLDEDLRGKLCDFGLARNMTMSTHMLTSIKGTPLYMAPELLEEKPYDHLADIWSLGCIAYECLIGYPPFTTTSIFHLIKIIKKNEVTYPGYLTKPCRSFLQSLLEKEATMRATWSQILCHPFVEGRLYIKAGVKSDNSPFINPQTSKPKYRSSSHTKESSLNLKKITEKLLTIKLDATDNNITSSQDSINAIPPSDIEQLETDIEDNINKGVVVPFADDSFNETEVIAKSNMEMAAEAVVDLAHIPGIHMPVINSQTCFVNGNNNMILNNFNDNFALSNISNYPQHHHNADSYRKNNSNMMIINTSNDNYALNDMTNMEEQLYNRKKSDATSASSAKKSQNSLGDKNKDTQLKDTSNTGGNDNLRKPSIDSIKRSKKDQTRESAQQRVPLPQVEDIENLKKPSISSIKRSKADKENVCLDLQSSSKSTHNRRENNSPENVAATSDVMPLWDSCDASQSPAMESDEWLEFLRRNMQEVLDGELASLKQKSLVSFIVTPLRNSKVISKVVESVTQLLSLPFVLTEPLSTMEVIIKVYAECKLVPNLMYASKLLIYERHMADSTTSLPRNARSINQLKSEEIKCISRVYELICHLVHLNQNFLNQFCDAVTILSANEFLIDFINPEFRNHHILRIANCVLALLGCVLRELPENAELIEKIIFSSKVNLAALLSSSDSLLRLRICMLIRLLGRFSLRALQTAWSKELREAIECLTDDDNVKVKEEANHTVDELRRFSFYS